ncbi:MAG: hypothetical protein QXJ06_04965 [Candidatus Aenigmatarchaeota archaeon]
MFQKTKEEEIESLLIKNVYMSEYAILTPQDSKRYIRTKGVSTCKVLTLYFPRQGIVALSHIPASRDLNRILLLIKKDLDLELIATEGLLYFF